MHHYLNILIFIFLIIASQVARGNIYQAETADLYKAVTETKNSGYIGDSYINFDNEPGSYLELRIGMAEAGMQSIEIRFANGGSATRPMEISLDGNTVLENVIFETTGEWTSWDTLSFNLEIPQGIHSLKFISTGSEGGPNLDQFEISGEQLTTYTINATISGNGSITQFPEKGLLFDGQNIVLMAKPGFASAFINWTGDYNAVSDTLEFVLHSNVSVQAVFEDINLEIPVPDFSMNGYCTVPGDGIQTTTGGEGGNIRVIETLAQLKSWGASREDYSAPEVIIIKGKIEAESTEVITIKRGGNISILGDSGQGGEYGELKNISLNIRQYSNVIVRNLKMHEVFYPNDDLTIDECHHVWIDHCEFHSKIGDGIGVDTYDGLLDIKKGSHNVTVSWCYFHDHMKTVLIGHSDNNGDQDQNLEVTFHHNWFSHTDGRNPSLRFGKVHYFNNYLDNISDYGFAVRNGAHAKIENCHFESVKLPIASDKFEGHGYACVSSCIYSGNCSEADNEITEPFDCGFWDTQIPYNYDLEDAQTVSLSVQRYAGVGQVDIPTSSHYDFKANNELQIEYCSFISNKNQINLRVNSDRTQDVEYSVYTVNGQKISVGSVCLYKGSQLIQLQVENISHGVYILQLRTQRKGSTKKVIL